MPLTRTIVLKLGGSVLRDELQMRSAVHEVYRWRRKGWRVLAVVSALTGRTDELLAKCARLYKRRSPLTEASVAASGELESAALLGLHLDRAGIPAAILTPAACRFRASGHPLRSKPLSIDTTLLAEALVKTGVVVFPGYVAVGLRGETLLLGRGGSDLTALYMAHALQADRCRLIKDVDGLYDRDPATACGAARRYSHATFDDALATDGSILQHAAVAFARDTGTMFEVGRPNGVTHSEVGGNTRQFHPVVPEYPPMRVALLGHGTVGAGVLELIQNLPHLFAIASVVVRDVHRHAHLEVQGVTVHDDPHAAATSDVDVVVEAMGGVSAAFRATALALKRGVHVVTANKSLLADHGSRLRSLARAHGARLLGSAAVGASAPITEAISQRAPTRIGSIRAVLNGTANFILNALTRGTSFQTALAEAQALGFAEADARRDLEGADAADKLRVLAQEAGLQYVGPRRASEAVSAALEQRAAEVPGLRQVAHLVRDGARALCSVDIEATCAGDPLACLADEENAAVIEWEDGTRGVIHGAGAGRWPTAEAVVADLLFLERERRRTGPQPDPARASRRTDSSQTRRSDAPTRQRTR